MLTSTFILKRDIKGVANLFLFGTLPILEFIQVLIHFWVQRKSIAAS